MPAPDGAPVTKVSAEARDEALVSHQISASVSALESPWLLVLVSVLVLVSRRA